MQSLILTLAVLAAPPLNAQDVKFTQQPVAPFEQINEVPVPAPAPATPVLDPDRVQPRISGVRTPLASTPAAAAPQPYASIPMAPQGPYTTQYAAASYSTGTTPCAPCGSQATTYQVTYNGSTPCGQPVAAAPCGQQAAYSYQAVTYQSYGYRQRSGFRPFRGWFRRG